MKAVILAGGLGTRLRPLTFSIPKPLLPVGEKPILQIIIEQLAESDIRELVLATGYQADLIRAFCGDGTRFGVNVRYVHEGKPLGTAGPLSLVGDCFHDGEYFILMNGDILTRLRFKNLLAAASASGCDLMVGYTQYTYHSPFGVLTISDGAVTGVTEKPTQEYLISAGIYALNTRALALIPHDTFFTIPDLIHTLIAAGKRVGAYHIKESWMGLETITHFEDALKELNNAPLHENTLEGPV